MKNKIRFDDSYEKVYLYSEKHNGFLFYTSYLALGIDSKMNEGDKIYITLKSLEPFTEELQDAN